MTRTWLRLIAIALALSGGVPAIAKTLKVGDTAPDFELTMIDGSKIRLSEMRGQVVLLNFWATWCGPCRKELPLLDSYYRIQAPKGLRAFAIATEDSVPTYMLKPLFAKMTMPSARRIKGPYDIRGGLPTNYVIDRAGVVRYAQAGAFDLDALNATLVPLLSEATPGT